MYPALFQQQQPEPSATAAPRIVISSARHLLDAESKLQVKAERAIDRWLELKQIYAVRCGFDRGANGKVVPKTSNLDVRQLALQWTEELSKLDQELERDVSEFSRWRTCLDIVANHACKDAPAAEYERNAEFWQCTRRLAIYLESRKLRLGPWQLWDHIVTRPEERNATAASSPALVIHSENAATQWVKLKRSYVALRGSSAGKNRKAIPHTTNADVMQLATMWSRELAKVDAEYDRDRSEHARWKACVERVKTYADANKPDQEYTRNEEFWSCAGSLALYLESRKMRPSRWTLAVESVKEALAGVPDTLGHATRSAAGAAANVVKDPIKLAAVLLGAAILLPPVISAVRK